jgi:hypothetical protein
MFGSWNHGRARFRNGTIYDTSVGYAATAATSFALVQDWKVPLAESLMVSPDDTCDSSSACGPTEAFDCNDVRRMLEMRDSSDVDNNRRLTNIDITCSETDCSNISVQLLKEACEQDIALTNDTSWACEPSKVNPIIVEPGPNDFVLHPSDAATGQSGGGTYSGFSSFFEILFLSLKKSVCLSSSLFVFIIISDPHFETFNGEAFSYHGECDLVMMKSPSFASGLGLYVHIRTTRIDNARSYSYISAAAVRIGKNDVLETKDVSPSSRQSKDRINKSLFTI